MNWPWQYSFPPFFTLQPNEDTLKKQLNAWCDLILEYCKHKQLFIIDLTEAQRTELFHNKAIERKCSPELLSKIIDKLVKTNRAEWIISGAPRSSSAKKATTEPDAETVAGKCFIFWKTPDEWSNEIYDYVARNNLKNNVCTFYELVESSESRKESFHKMNKEVFEKAIHVLQKQAKAELIYLDDNSDLGVKFF